MILNLKEEQHGYRHTHPLFSTDNINFCNAITIRVLILQRQRESMVIKQMKMVMEQLWQASLCQRRTVLLKKLQQ